MVEELKLAIKIDDATIEQSLLKQFANAQKMADKVVLDFKNVNFDDKQIEAKFKEMQKKAGQNPIDLTIGGNTLDMLGQIDKRLTEIFSIGKGKSFIDSSSIATDIGKIENKINELNKKYEESQKKLSSIGSGGISGKDVNLVDNEELKKLSQEVSELKNQFDDLKTHMQLLDDYTVPTDRFFELQSQVETTTVKVSDLVEEFAKLSNAQKALSSTPQESNISFGDSTSNAIDTQVKKQREYNDLVAVGYDRIQKMKKISESGTTGQNSVYDLLRLNHEAWDEVKANNFFNTIPEEGLKRYTKILEVVEKIVQEMVQASGLTEDQIVSQLKNIKSAQGGNFKLNGADSGWTHFATYSNGQKDSMQKPNGITYKVYAAFDDIKDLNQNVVSSIMDELTKAGFKGRLKTTSGSTSFGDKLNGLAITDQMVVHGSTKKDQEIAYNTLKNMGLKLSYLGGGIDTPDGSFSQTLASGEINKYVQGLEKEATTARDTAKAEQELANARKESTSTVSQNQKKDAFPDSSTNTKPETEGMEQVEKATEEAVQAKKDFATANEGVQSSIDGSKNPLKLEAELMEQIAKSAREAADAKKEFVEANKQVKDSADESNSDLKAKPKKDRYAKRRKVSEEDFLNYSPNRVNEKLSNSGYTILGETVNTELVDGLVKVSAKIKDADGAWKSFSAKVDADGNIFEQRFKTVTNGVDKLETALQNFGRETAPALTYQETLDKAQKIKNSLNLGDEYSIKVDSSEFVTITKKLTDVENTGTSVTQTFKSAQDAIDNFGKSASNSAEKTSVALKSVKSNIKEVTDESEKLENAQKEQNANVTLNKYDKQLDSYNGKVDKYQATIDRFNDGGWTSDTYLKNVQAVRDAVKQYTTLLDNIKTNQNGIASDEDIQNLDKYEKKIKDTIATVTNMSASEKGYNFVSAQKELDKIHKLLNENSNMSAEAKAKIKSYYAEIESGNPSMSLDRIHGEIMKIYNAEVKAGRAGKSFFDTLKNSGFHQLAAQMAGMFGFYDVINLGKQAFNTVKELDYALVDLKKTTAMNSSELEQFYYDSNDVAKQMGVTTKEIIDQASSWSRLGYNSKQAATEMAKLSSQFSLISPGMDTTTAQEGLVSIMKAWDIGYQDVKSQIMDNINALGNAMAEDNQDIVEGMERSAAALAAVGTSTKDAFALFSGIQEVLQNSEKSGTSLRSVALRLRSFDESTEEYSSDLANITGELADLTKTAEHAQGVSVFKPGSTTEFKNLVDYFREIADIWDEMSQKQQNDFLLKAFGRTQAQAGAALIQNFKGVEKALDVMDDAIGSSDKEMETAKQSITYKLNELKQTWVGTVQDIANRDDLGKIVDGLTDLSSAIGFVIDKLGLVGTVGLFGGAGTGIFKFIKNFDWVFKPYTKTLSNSFLVGQS